VGAATLVAKARAHTAKVGNDQEVDITAKPKGETVVVTPTADIIELAASGYVLVSTGKGSFQVNGSAFLCVKQGGCECPPGKSYDGPRLDTIGPGKISIELIGKTKLALKGVALDSVCQPRDRCLFGTWNADLSGYLASYHVKVISLSGTETYFFGKRGRATADANNYTINAVDVKDNATLTFIVNGSASTHWLTPTRGTLQLGSLSTGWTGTVTQLKETFPVNTGAFSFLGAWGSASGPTYQCSGSGASVEYWPSPNFSPIVLTRVSS
jgi:hypothetical protein